MSTRATPSPTPLAWRDGLVLGITSVAGLGYVPVAPGTCGTLAAVAAWPLLPALTPAAYVVALVALILVACLTAARAEQIYGAHDAQRIVIDEVAGFFCTVVAVPFSWRNAAAAFVLFRLLDACKPGPIGYIDRRVAGGVGVVADDVAAGLLGCALLHLSHTCGWLPW